MVHDKIGAYQFATVQAENQSLLCFAKGCKSLATNASASEQYRWDRNCGRWGTLPRDLSRCAAHANVASRIANPVTGIIPRW